MNILHVLSGDFVAGSETSTVAIIEEQIGKGHRVFIASGRFTHPTKAKIFEIPIYDRGLLRRFSNVLAVRGIIRREKIDMVHAHSRAASWISYWACRSTKTAYLSTFHGRQHLHFSSRHFNVYGRHCVAVCENIREQMLDQTKLFKSQEITVIRNGFEL